MSIFGSHASGPSAVVAVPREFTKRGRLSLGKGVAERLTYRCYVGFDEAASLHMSPLRNDFFTVALREGLYLLLETIEAARSRFRPGKHHAPRVGSIRHSYWTVRSVLAKGLVRRTPIADQCTFSEFSYSYRDINSRIWFEASRRVLQYESYRVPGGHSIEIVCHVLAPNRHDLTDRLFSRLAQEMAQDQPFISIRDDASDLVIKSRVSRRLAHKRYCDVVIAPQVFFVSGQSMRLWTKSGPRNLRYRLDNDLLVDDMEVNPRASLSEADGLTVGVGADICKENRLDWRFIVGELLVAVDRGQPLDEHTIRTIAKRRFHYASENFDYPDRPGSGPTEDSSERIVRSVVELHLLATDPDYAGSLPQWD